MKIACVGIFVADVIVEKVLSVPEKGKLDRVNSITVHNGGNAMTASINVRKLGVDTCAVGMVGNDVFGEFLKKRFAEYNIDTRAIKVSDDAQTSTSVALIDADGERSFLHCTGTNSVFSVNDINYDIIAECDLVFVTGSFLMDTFDGSETMEFLKKCKEMGKTTFLDVCWDAKGNWAKLLDMSMPYIDFFMPSIDEAVCLTDGETDPEKIADIFMSKGVKNVIIKLGSKGSFLREAGKVKGEIFPPFFIENAVDTTGAGDSFCSGFLAAYARGFSLPACVEFANAVGAHCVMAMGATTGIKSFEETMEFIIKRKNK